MPDIPDELMRDLLKTFQVEAAEHLQLLNQTLLKIERVAEDTERHEMVKTAFRAAHSLKGAARAVELHDIENLAHSMESVLQQARDLNLALEPKVCDVLYGILDGIQHLLAGQPVDTGSLQARLTAAMGSLTLPPSVPPDSPVEAEELTAILPADDTIRIAIDKLDEMMAQTGELLISKINAEQRLADVRTLRQQMAKWPAAWREIKPLLKHIDGDAGQRLRGLLTQHYDYLQNLSRAFGTFEQALGSDTLRLGMVTTDLQDDVRRARMLPFQTIALSLERTVRDAARTEGKQVVFAIEGSEVELDKKVLEMLKDPLLHLLRNAVSHGIEMPEERETAGKPSAGRVKLLARQRGSEISLMVSDDGRGFDLERLRQAGRSQRAVEDNNSDDIISLAFLPGVTTAHQVTAISGRGVGLDIVRQRVEDLHGRITVNNVPGKGASIDLIVPSSVTMTRGLIVRCGDEHFALPLLSIERIIEARDTFSVGGKQMLRLEPTSIPLIPLLAILERPLTANGKASTFLAVIISVGDQRLALWVDEVIAEMELAVKPLGEPLRRVRNVAGAALLGTGEPIVILNPGDLVRSARGVRMPEHQLNGNNSVQNEELSGGHILVVDDSITTRTLEKNILEAAGFQVTIAIDGIEALKRLNEQPVDLVVTDIQMPNMDGITLTRQIRETADHKHMPVILVTSLESQGDREQGMLAGADAYIVKRGFNQATLLATIRQFLEKVI